MDLRGRFVLMMVMLALLCNNVESGTASCSSKCKLKGEHCIIHGCDIPVKDVNDLKEVTAAFEYQ